MQFIEDDSISFYFCCCTISYHDYYIRFKEKERLLVFGNFFLFTIYDISFFPTDHVKQIQTRFDFVSWQDGVYAFSAGLVVNVSLLVAAFLVYRLCVRTVKFIGRKW